MTIDIREYAQKSEQNAKGSLVGDYSAPSESADEDNEAGLEMANHCAFYRPSAADDEELRSKGQCSRTGANVGLHIDQSSQEATE